MNYGISRKKTSMRPNKRKKEAATPSVLSMPSVAKKL